MFRPTVCFLFSLVLAADCLSGCSAKNGLASKPSGGSEVRPPNSGQTIWAAVYTAAQAESGESLYRQKCASCHGRELQGDDDYCAPALVDRSFWRKWEGTSVGKFYARIQETMPEGQPGSLSPQEYAEIVSFVLSANKIPAGTKDLPTELSTLNQIVMTNRSPQR